MTKAELIALLAPIPNDAILDTNALKEGRLVFTDVEYTATCNGVKVRV